MHERVSGEHESSEERNKKERNEYLKFSLEKVTEKKRRNTSETWNLNCRG